MSWRTLADDLAQLARLDRIIERQARDVAHWRDVYEFSDISMTGRRQDVPDPARIAEARARWESARRRLRWMEAKRDRFKAAVDRALRASPSPFA